VELPVRLPPADPLREGRGGVSLTTASLGHAVFLPNIDLTVGA
jgi:hypothetical protein